MNTNMEINKFRTNKITDDSVELYLPIEKVDRERRIVSGFATLDNLDKHGDIVTADASRDAFKSFRGNIREMHMPKAVGKMVNFTERELQRGTITHKGIFVEVYVSKGAEDTWQKVLDGTLSGFSIGGNINPDAVEKNEAGGRIIKEYRLNELSLVDSPANQLANVFSIQKSEDSDEYTFTGFATEESEEDFTKVNATEGTNLVTTESGNYTTTTTNGNVSFYPSESTTDESRFEKFLEKFEEVLTKTIGGNTMTTQTEETAVDEVEDTQTEEVVESVEDTAVEKAADVSEVEEVEVTEDAVDTDDMVDSIVEKVLERLNSGIESDAEVAEETSDEEEAVAKSDDLNDVEDTLTKSIDSLAKTITDKLEELANTVSTLKSETNERLTGLEDASAVRKSSVTGGSSRTRESQSDFWSDSALGGTNSNA